MPTLISSRRWWALAALVLSVLVIGLDATVLNVALPTLAVTLGATTGDLQWIVDAYLIPFAALMLPAGVFGDRFGRRRLLLAGLAVFGVASALATTATGPATLIAARVLLGCGAALIMVLSTSILPGVFPPHERAKAIAVWSAGMAALVYGVIEAPVRGWSHPGVLAAVLAGLAVIALFVLVEARSKAPMLDLALFRDRVFLWGSLGATYVSLSMMGVLFVVPLYLQSVLGHDAFGTGIRVIPMVVGLMIGGLGGERLLRVLGLRVIMPLGLLVLAAGLTAGALTDVSSTYGATAGWLSIVGVGVGLAMVPAMDGVLAVLPEDRTGAGSGTLQALRQVGGAFGVAGLGSLLSAVYTGALPAGAPKAAADSVAAAVRLGDPALAAAAGRAFVTGMDAVLGVCALLALTVTAAVAVFMRGAETRQSAHELTSAP